MFRSSGGCRPNFHTLGFHDRGEGLSVSHTAKSPTSEPVLGLGLGLELQLKIELVLELG